MSNPIPTARRNLAWRIEQFFRGLEANDVEPTVDQMVNLHDALSALELGAFSVGEDAMMLAERGWAPRQGPVRSQTSMPELVEWHHRLIAEGK